MEAIVLAGGLGTRLKSVLPSTPKPMAPVNGRPFLEYLLTYWKAQGVKRFVLSVGHLSEQITSHFGNDFQGIPIAYSREELPQGTGGGLMNSLDLLHSDGPSLLLNGDTFLGADLCVLINFFKKNSADLLISLYQMPIGSRYGTVVVDRDHRVKSFHTVEQIPQSGILRENWINAGVYLFLPARLQQVKLPKRPLSFEAEILPYLIKENSHLVGCQVDGPFLDIGIPEDYAAAGALLDGFSFRRSP